MQHAAPMPVWLEAEKQARRSPMKRHRTGAVVFYGMGSDRSPKIYARGCSHTNHGGYKMASMHAERSALDKLHDEYGGAVCLVVTLTKAGNYAHSSKPCLSCAALLKDYVWGVIYAEKANDGSWSINKEDPADIIARAVKPAKLEGFAKDLRA